MPIIKYLDRIKQMHRLIKQRATGTPQQLAQKLGLSERQTYEYIREIRDMGIPLAFDNFNKTYYYNGEVSCILEYKPLSTQDIKKKKVKICL
jgi:predicted DNA-binding transcriptional regulator YafY